MSACPMLIKPYPLPCTYLQLPLMNRNSQLHPHQLSLDMCRHITEPSAVCLYKLLSSTISLFKLLSMSSRTSGSQFSFRDSEQEVCCRNRCMVPSLYSFSSGRLFTISEVIRWQPLFLCFNVILFWNHLVYYYCYYIYTPILFLFILFRNLALYI